MRILFITATRIGDVVLSSGLFQWLATTHPQARMTVACGAVAESLFRAHPQVERIIPLSKRPLGGHWRSLWWEVVRKRWDMVVDLRRSLLPWTVRAGVRRSIPHPRPGQHRVQLIAATLGLDPPPPPSLWIGAPERARAAEILAGGDEPVLAIAATANWAGKIWPGERFAELVQRLTRAAGPLAGARIFVTAGRGEEALARPFLDSIPEQRRIACIGLDLLVAAAMFQRCRLFIGNDSGLMHLAAAAGTPTIGLFGPTRDELYRPWGEHCRVVRTPESVEELTGHTGYDHRTTGSLMGTLTVDAVERTVVELLSASSQPPSAAEPNPVSRRRHG
ncbi:MAG: glycosyltransferase family 9 protein [Rhodospirillales bacterium]|nr:MAG: glycosyltransferase family 9 protein [Rhodospirillales bacterium]